MQSNKRKLYVFKVTFLAFPFMLISLLKEWIVAVHGVLIVWLSRLLLPSSFLIEYLALNAHLCYLGIYGQITCGVTHYTGSPQPQVSISVTKQGSCFVNYTQFLDLFATVVKWIKQSLSNSRYHHWFCLSEVTGKGCK